MTLGFTLVCTASRMSRPARSMAVAVFQGSSMLALLAAIIALMTRCTLPPARYVRFHLRRRDLQARRGAPECGVLTIASAFTFRRRIPIRSTKPDAGAADPRPDVEAR